MRSRAVFSVAFVSSVAVFSACGGKLHVGEERRGPVAGEGGEASDGAGGSGDRAGGSNGGAAGSSAASGGKGAGTGGSAATGGSATTGGTGNVAGMAGTANESGGSAGTGGAAAPGTGGSSDPGSGGSGGTAVPEPQPEFDPVPAIDGSSEGCPEGPGLEAKACESQGMTCGYASLEDGYHYVECACGRTETGLAWNCYANNGSNATCPATAPEHESDCFGFYGTSCYYPVQKECSCSSDDGAWNCMTPPPPTDLNPPDSADSEGAVAEMSEAEREEWCTWYTSLTVAPGFPPTPNLEVRDDGYLEGPGCNFAPLLPCQAGVAVISRAQCVQNLAATACEAQVSHLTECVSNVFTGCGPTTNGCADLFAAGCSGTIATKILDRFGLPSCSVRVR